MYKTISEKIILLAFKEKSLLFQPSEKKYPKIKTIMADKMYPSKIFTSARVIKLANPPNCRYVRTSAQNINKIFQNISTPFVDLTKISYL